MALIDAENQALAIYERMVAVSGERPAASESMEQLLREIAASKKNNPALAELGRVASPVLLAFLNQSFDWLRAEAHLAKNYNACATLSDGIQIALSRLPKPLPPELVARLIGQYCGAMGSMAHMFFPIRPLVSSISREHVTEEVRTELRKLHLQLAPSPNGKIEAGTLEFRLQIAGLMSVEGEIRLGPGRGPWLQIVFDEINMKDEITRSGWEGLLEHCRVLEQAMPGAKW